MNSHIATFLSVVLITEMLEICIQTSYDQNVQLILMSYLPVVYGTPLIGTKLGRKFSTFYFLIWGTCLFQGRLVKIPLAQVPLAGKLKSLLWRRIYNDLNMAFVDRFII
jgi:hypothetical protein